MKHMIPNMDWIEIVFWVVIVVIAGLVLFWTEPTYFEGQPILKQQGVCPMIKEGCELRPLEGNNMYCVVERDC